MDPGFDISLNTPEDATSYEAKGHFLESLGLSERHLLGESFSGRVETLGDDGVVLSSMPDDLGFPSPGKAPDRSLSLSFSISEQKGRETALAISLPAEEANQPEPAEATNKSTGPEASQAEGPDETLHLQCPECRGSLVLSRRHLSIEGTCVWCQTPIVAAESARDGQVCIFPILGHAAEEPKSAIRLTIPAVDSKSLHLRDRAPELRPEPSTGEATVPAISEAEDRLMVPGPEEPFQPNSKGAAREDRGGEIDHQNLASSFEIVAGSGSFSPPDLDSLSDTGGFLSSQIEPTLPARFGEKLLTPNLPAAPEEEVVAAANFVGSVPAPVPSWDAPLGGLGGLAAPDLNPTHPLVAETFESKGLPSRFLDGDFSTTPVSAFASDSFSRNSDHFSAPFLSGPEAFQESKPQGEGMAFLPPFHGFATGSSSDEESGPARSLFGDSTPAASPRNSDPISGETPTLPAPLRSTAAPVPPFQLFSALGEDPSPFDGFHSDASPSPFTDFRVDDSNPTTAETAMSSPFEDQPPSSTTPPAPISDQVIAETVAGAAPWMPQLISQPLGAKPKPVARKSFIILMVVIVGFASGAALASFVLPVEEYVSAARSYMVSKFGTGVEISRMPAMREGMATVPNASTASSPSQP